jgi:Fe2+ transport system protein FeoA
MANKKRCDFNPGSIMCEGLNKLSCAKRGACKFVSTCCDEKLAHRLSEMGFTPGGNIKVVSCGNSNGSVMVEVKGSKLALSNKIADSIFIKEEI